MNIKQLGAIVLAWSVFLVTAALTAVVIFAGIL